MAIRQSGSDLVVTNINSAKYPDKTFSVDPMQVCLLVGAGVS